MHQALERLVADDKPRPGLTGGVGRIRPAQIGGRRCDIACIGTGTEHTGLLKSLNEDGSWHGGVYVVPFHAHVDVALVANRPRATLARGRTIVIGPLVALDSGEQIEIVTRASSAGGRGILRFTVLREGRPLPGLTHDIKVGNSLRPARYVLRNQLPTDGISIRVEAINANVELRDLAAYRESEQTTKLTKGKFGGKRHRGAVTFDVVSTPQEIGSQRTTPGGGTAPLR